jgi:hypothetical protein
VLRYRWSRRPGHQYEDDIEMVVARAGFWNSGL